jgi:hypothetical protein
VDEPELLEIVQIWPAGVSAAETQATSDGSEERLDTSGPRSPRWFDAPAARRVGAAGLVLAVALAVVVPRWPHHASVAGAPPITSVTSAPAQPSVPDVPNPVPQAIGLDSGTPSTVFRCPRGRFCVTSVTVPAATINAIGQYLPTAMVGATVEVSDGPSGKLWFRQLNATVADGVALTTQVTVPADVPPVTSQSVTREAAITTVDIRSAVGAYQLRVLLSGTVLGTPQLQVLTALANDPRLLAGT